MSDNNVNTMIELTKTNKITIGVVVALLVLVLGFIFLKPAKYVFNTQLGKELADVKVLDYQVSPQEVAKAILSKDQNMVLVDVRSQFDYAKSHLPEAKNIYKVNLFDDDNIAFFNDIVKGNKKVVLYGDTAAEANDLFMILKQMGYSNISYLTVGYDVLKAGNWNEIAADSVKYNDEAAVVDFAKFIEDAQNSATTEGAVSKPKTESKPKVIVPVSAPAGGGDEGC